MCQQNARSQVSLYLTLQVHLRYSISLHYLLGILPSIRQLFRLSGFFKAHIIIAKQVFDTLRRNF